MLAAGALAYAVAVILYVVVYGQPEGTGPGGTATLADRVAHLHDHWSLAQAMWFVEGAAAVCIAIAAFGLQHRTSPQRVGLPPQVAWATVGVGALLLAMMYPFMLGGYPDALAVFDETPGLIAVLNSIATFLFHLGNAVLSLGLAGVFITEATAPGVLPRWLALTGAALCLLGTGAAIGLLAGIGSMAAAAPGGVVGFLLTAYLGTAIWRRAGHNERDAVSEHLDDASSPRPSTPE